jgi:hypothetical protein
MNGGSKKMRKLGKGRVTPNRLFPALLLILIVISVGGVRFSYAQDQFGRFTMENGV